jgi:hypothetical protein
MHQVQDDNNSAQTVASEGQHLTLILKYF